MAWRIHFTEADYEQIQINPTLGPLAETMMALSMLRSTCRSQSLYPEWRSQVRGKITPRMGPLTSLIPEGHWGVDLTTLAGDPPTIELGLQALRTVPREDLLVEMAYVDRYKRLPKAAWRLAEVGAREPLAEAAEAAYEALVQPYWHRMLGFLQAEQAVRSRTLAREGVDSLLASLQGQWIRWRPPILEVQLPSDNDLHLDGRGIVLVPSVFIGRMPGLHQNPNDDQDAPRLVLPAAGAVNAELWNTRHDREAALAALVGRNRAAVLRNVADGATTTELAERAGISIAAASQHATVLRDAGLLASRRLGGTVLHVLTPLGAELVEGE